MTLTTPPYALRESLFSTKAARHATALARRLPPWVIVCPRVRLDALLTPTPPDGRDPDDWRRWRKRVRLRAVDLLLVDRRTWAPLVAVQFKRGEDARSLKRARRAGRDMLLEEVLHHVGLPLVAGTGRVADDWPAIRPWIEQALIEGVPELRPASDDPWSDGGHDDETVAELLQLDDDEGTTTAHSEQNRSAETRSPGSAGAA